MELLEGVTTRRSIRAFKPTPVPRGTLEKVLEAASRSPSCMNTQPWEVHVVTGKKRDELSAALLRLAEADTPTNPDIPAPQEWPPEFVERYTEHQARRFQALGIERSDNARKRQMRLGNFRWYGAPCVLILTIDRRLSTWSVFDMGLFIANLTLAAHAVGLGTCIQALVVNYPDTIRKVMGIPETKTIVLGVSIGYTDAAEPVNSYRSQRVSPDKFTTWYE